MLFENIFVLLELYISNNCIKNTDFLCSFWLFLRFQGWLNHFSINIKKINFAFQKCIAVYRLDIYFWRYSFFSLITNIDSFFTPKHWAFLNGKPKYRLEVKSLWTKQTILTCKRICIIHWTQSYQNLLNKPKLKVIFQRECMTLRLQGYNFNFEIS